MPELRFDDTSEDRIIFKTVMAAALRKAALRDRIEPHAEGFALQIRTRVGEAGDPQSSPAGSHPLTLARIYGDCRMGPPENRADAIEAFAAAIASACHAPPLPNRFSAAKPQLRVVATELDVYAGRSPGVSPQVFRTVGEQVALKLVYDASSFMVNLTESQLANWSITPMEAVDAAVAATRASTQLAFRRSPSGVWIVEAAADQDIDLYGGARGSGAVRGSSTAGDRSL